MTKYPGTTTSSITFFSIIYKRSIDPSTLNRYIQLYKIQNIPSIKFTLLCTLRIDKRSIDTQSREEKHDHPRRIVIQARIIPENFIVFDVIIALHATHWYVTDLFTACNFELHWQSRWCIFYGSVLYF